MESIESSIFNCSSVIRAMGDAAYLYGVMGNVNTNPSSKMATHFSLSLTFAAR